MRTRLAAALALVIALAAVPAAADYRQSYLDGRRALERGDLGRAVELLEAAARERPVEQARARLVGAIPEPYLPHHYLGLAHYRARRCPQALAEWALSERQGAVREVAAAHALARRHRAECESLAAAEAEIARAAEAAAELDRARAAGGGRRREDVADLAERSRPALSGLEDARASLEAGRREWDFGLVAAALENARAAAAALEALAEDARRPPAAERLAERDPAAPPGRSTEPEPSPGAGPPGAAEPDDAGAGSPARSGPPDAPGTTEAAVPPAAEAGAAPDPDAGTAAGPAPPEAERPAPPGEPPPADADAAALPPGLLAGIQAYFDGDYRRALTRLGPGGGDADPAPGSGRAGFLAALFRGAALHALYLLGGERDAGLLRAARADLAACRRADPGFAPRADHFSPRFVAFYAALP